MNKVDKAITAADTLANWYAGMRRALPWGATLWFGLVILAAFSGSSVALILAMVVATPAASYLTYRVYNLRMAQLGAMDAVERQVFLHREDDNRRAKRAAANARVAAMPKSSHLA